MKSNLCIDLQSDLLTAVLFDGNKSQGIVASTIVVTAGKAPEEVVAELVATIDCSHCNVSLSLGASFFLFRNLSLPFSDRKSIEKILPFELDESIIQDIGTLLIDTHVTPGSGKDVEIIAAMLERERLSQWHAAFQDVGIFFERITLSGQPSISGIFANGQPPETFLFLSLRTNDAALFLIAGGVLQLVRPLPFELFESDADESTGFVFDKKSGELIAQGLKTTGDAYKNLAVAVKQTLEPLASVTDFAKIAIYVEGSGGLMPNARSWLDEAFEMPCFVCGRGGILPVSANLPEQTGQHAEYLTSCFSLGAYSDKIIPEFDFCKEGFSLTDPMARYRLLGKGLVLCLVLVFVASTSWLVYDNSLMKKKQNGLKADIRTVFQETLPDITRIVDPIQQLQVAINGAQFSSGEDEGTVLPFTALHVLREISSHIPPSLDVLLTRMVYDEKGIRLIGVTDNFNSVDSIKKNLEKSVEILSVTINSTNQDPKKNSIRFELTLDMGEAKE